MAPITLVGNTTNVQRTLALPSPQQLDMLIASVQSRIQAGAASGQLTQGQVIALQQKVDALKGARGRDPQIEAKLKALGEEVASQAKDMTVDYGQRLAAAETLIAAGLRDGSLTAAEANALTRQVATARNAWKQASGGVFRVEEQARVLDLLKRLDSSISSSRGDGVVDFAKRKAALLKSIEGGVQRGQITAAEAKELRARVEQVNQGGAAGDVFNRIYDDIREVNNNAGRDVQQQLRSFQSRIDTLLSQGKLTVTQANELSARVTSLRNNPPKDATALRQTMDALGASISTAQDDAQENFIARGDFMQRRLDARVADGSLTAAEAQELRTRLNALLADAKNNPSASAKIQLKYAFDRLEERFSALANNNVRTPKPPVPPTPIVEYPPYPPNPIVEYPPRPPVDIFPPYPPVVLFPYPPVQPLTPPWFGPSPLESIQLVTQMMNVIMEMMRELTQPRAFSVDDVRSFVGRYGNALPRLAGAPDLTGFTKVLVADGRPMDGGLVEAWYNGAGQVYRQATSSGFGGPVETAWYGPAQMSS